MIARKITRIEKVGVKPTVDIEVKSRFTYEVLIGNKSYSKHKKSNHKQAEKIKWVSQNIKEVRIAIIDGETIEYILLK